jgi:hypothetical protein
MHVRNSRFNCNYARAYYQYDKILRPSEQHPNTANREPLRCAWNGARSSLTRKNFRDMWKELPLALASTADTDSRLLIV